ncbi:MAG: PAS domain-containing protein [Gammaproteobacteria bacterium]|nr:PAS domain-containing protein [Gammaproteobacteria bacterium]MBU1967990.1 PAS domain-containing protein [Gammaproteobacteria bacterium]
MRDSPSVTGTFPYLQTAAPLSQESLWRSISFFNLYRLILGGVLLLVPTLFGEIFERSILHQRLFFWVATAYTVLVLVSVLAVVLRKSRPMLQLAFQICTDIAAVAMLAYFGGGIQSNLGMLLLVSLALAGMIARGRITLLFAALASIAMLLQHGFSVLTSDATVAQYLQTGILCASYFAVAWLAHTLSRYAVASEKLAFRRGVDLSNMAEANRLMIQDMPDGVLVVDERGVVRQSNPGAERMLGYVFPPGDKCLLEDCSPLLSAMFAVWRQNKAFGHEVLRLPGTNHPVRVRFLPVQRDGFWGAVVVLEDMQRAQEQAQQVKLAALGRLTANIAHEVRNPLSSISYATELLNEQEHDEAQSRLFQIILDNTRRLNRIVQDVMQVNRRDRLQAEILNLSERLDELIDNLCQVEQVPRTVFSMQVDASCAVRFDRGHFEQVLWNLCRNALRYSQRRDGSVIIRATTADDGKVTLEVADDGPGVSGDAEQKLFEPFFTTDSGGTGLGLYIARELCEANGAMIDYRRGPDGGARFRIQFGGNNET